MRETTDRRRVLLGAAAGTGAALLTGGGVAGAQTPPADSVFNVKAYGAVGDFWTNDTAAIQATIDAALATAAPRAGGIVWFPAGWYRVTSTLKLNGATFNIFDKSLTLQGVGDASVLFATNTDTGTDPNWKFAGNRLLEAHGQAGPSSALGSGQPAGTRQLVVPQALADTLKPGSILAIEENITSGWVYGTNGKPFELHKVVSKGGTGGTTLDLDSPLLHSYSAAGIVYKITPVQGLRVRDLAISAAWDPAPLPGVYSMFFRHAANVTIERVRLYNAAGGIILGNVVDAHVSDVTIDGLPKYDGSYGYGVAAAGASAGVSVTGLVGRGTRHLFTTLSDQRSATDFYGGPRNVTVLGGVGEGGDVRPDGQGPLAVWDTHEFGTGIAFLGCSATGVGTPGHSGFQVRAKRVRLVDCVSKHNALRGVAVVDAVADDTTISGGEMAYNGECGIAAGVNSTVTGVEVHHNGARGVNWGGGTRIHVTNCYVHDNVNEGIRDQGATGSKAQNVVITGNIVPKGSGSFPQTVACQTIGGPNAVVANNIFRGYGATNDGCAGFEAGVVKQNNVIG